MSIVSQGLMLFSSSRAVYNQGRLTHFPSPYRKMTLGLSAARFVGQTLFRILFVLFGITCTRRHKRDYDEQKAVVVLCASLYQGCQARNLLCLAITGYSSVRRSKGRPAKFSSLI